jgi:hypothetical protein
MYVGSYVVNCSTKNKKDNLEVVVYTVQNDRKYNHAADYIRFSNLKGSMYKNQLNRKYKILHDPFHKEAGWDECENCDDDSPQFEFKFNENSVTLYVRIFMVNTRQVDSSPDGAEFPLQSKVLWLTQKDSSDNVIIFEV